MALPSEANARGATLTDERYEDEDSFELIPPVISVSKNAPRNISSPPPKRRRWAQSPQSSSAKTRTMMTIRERKHHSSPKNQQQHAPWFAAMIVILLLVVGSAFLCRHTAGPHDIEELRLELKRDIESLRSEVEHDLVAHFLTTTKVHTVTEVEAMEPERGLETEPVPTVKSSSGIEPVRFTMESEATVDTPSFGHALKEEMEDGYRMLENQLQSIEMHSLLNWIRDAMFRGLQTMYMVTIVFWDSAQNTVLCHAKPIYASVVDSWDFAQRTVLNQLQAIYDTIFSLDWIQNPTIRRGVEFANQHRLEFCAWYMAWLLLLYNWYRCYFGGNPKVSSKASDSVNPSADAKGSDDECSENNDDPEEKIGDIVMEHMFHDSMATTGNRDWPTVFSPVYSRGNRTSNNRNRATTTGGNGSNSRASSNNSSNTNVAISKEEERRRARINAREFAARDKLRLAGGNVVAHVPNSTASSARRGNAQKVSKEERRRRARIHALEFAAQDKQRLAGNGGKTAAAAAAAAAVASASLNAPRNADSSPWASKRARLKQARANAKLYAEQDKQRLQKAAADSPWNRRNRNI